MNSKKKFNLKNESSLNEQNKPVPPAQVNVFQKQIEDLQKRLVGKSLLIATPMYGGQCFGVYSRSINELLLIGQRLGVNIQTTNILGESLIPRARNYQLQTFFDSTATHLITIDADIAFNPYDVLTMLAYCGEKDPTNGIVMDAVSGVYPKKSISWDKVYHAIKNDLVTEEFPEEAAKYSVDFVVNPIPNRPISLGAPFEVAEVGTGFFLTSREVLEKVAKANENRKYYPDHVRSEGFEGKRMIYNLYVSEVEPETLRYTSEDYGINKLMRDAGFTIWVFPWISLTHVGQYNYSGSIVDIGKLHSTISNTHNVSLSGPVVRKS